MGEHTPLHPGGNENPRPPEGTEGGKEEEGKAEKEEARINRKSQSLVHQIGKVLIKYINVITIDLMNLKIKFYT